MWVCCIGCDVMWDVVKVVLLCGLGLCADSVPFVCRLCVDRASSTGFGGLLRTLEAGRLRGIVRGRALEFTYTIVELLQ